MPIAEAAMRTLEAAGVSKDDLARSYFKGEGISLRSAAAQEIILKAALSDRAKAGIAQPDKPPVPPSQRPGVAGQMRSADDSDSGALTRKLAKSGSLKDATALRLAKLRARE
jgi:hypothetical protein